MNRLKRASTLVVSVTIACVIAAGVAHPAKSVYAPRIEPANFQSGVDHPYFPLKPGTKLRYVEKEGSEVRDNRVAVTSETKTIMGVECVVVHDELWIGGKLFEDTYDWYAQDKKGNVWYFGEDTREFHAGGKVDTHGSWLAGVGGAQPGIVMPAPVTPGAAYRQEYLAGEAEDMGQIIAVAEKVTVPAGSYTNCVRIKEWSMLESGTARKWYAKGIGCIRAQGPGREVSTLTSVTHP
ncbi:MAG: hypothetical protein ABIU54_03305 [Candidatus Eisenbacteria bacterium]